MHVLGAVHVCSTNQTSFICDHSSVRTDGQNRAPEELKRSESLQKGEMESSQGRRVRSQTVSDSTDGNKKWAFCVPLCLPQSPGSYSGSTLGDVPPGPLISGFSLQPGTEHAPLGDGVLNASMWHESSRKQEPAK